MMSVEQSVEWELAEETEILDFVHHKSHMTWPGLEPKPATNRLSYDTAY
jgi:hypothetical protein